jgi:hypothetical protein
VDIDHPGGFVGNTDDDAHGIGDWSRSWREASAVSMPGRSAALDLVDGLNKPCQVGFTAFKGVRKCPV